MPNIAKMLNDEIQRLARHEIKLATTSLKKDNAVLKHTAAAMKRRLARLESLNKRLLAQAEAARPKGAEVMDDEVKTARITGKMICAIRSRLGLSQDAFAKLVGVSSQSVYQWERKDGRLDFRGGAKAAIVGIRRMRKKEAKERLAEIKQDNSRKSK